MTARTIEQCIRQRRQQIAVHSYLYYQLDSPIVSDDTWQRWADELVTLQQQPHERVPFYDREFFDWDGSTGMHLPKDPWIAGMAAMVLRLHERYQPRPTAEKTPPAPAPQAPALFDAPRKKAAPQPPPQMSLF